MKHLFTSVFLLLTGLVFSQNQEGFTITSTANITVENSDQFALTKGTESNKLKQTNTFNISFADSIFIHTPAAYKDKEGKHEMISQVYKITNIVAVVDKNGVDLYLITVQSGNSGKFYDYYIEYNGVSAYLTQIFSMNGTKEEGYLYSGVLYNNLTHCVIRSFEKLN